jgi:hypothetical protein
MQAMRLVSERLARPRLLYPHELPPYLQRDIGLIDGQREPRRRQP